MISSFQKLAPVKHVNFLGYWDPISSKGDPDPVSTGFINRDDDSAPASISRFLANELRCMGGGDEPEDIPAALRKLEADLDQLPRPASGLVHFVFLIADAGFRPNEQDEMTRLSQSLADRGAVIVLCPCGTAGDSMARLRATLEAAFFPVGQYIMLPQVSLLADISAQVVGALRASLQGSSNLVAVTASRGATLDALSQLMVTRADHAELGRVKELTAEPELAAAKSEPLELADADPTAPLEEAMTDTAVAPASGDAPSMLEAPARVPADEQGQIDCLDGPPDAAEKPITVVARAGKFEVTAHERRLLQLTRLPPACQQSVQVAFGGNTLLERTAQSLAKRLLESNTGILALRKAGYPYAIVDLVKERMMHH